MTTLMPGAIRPFPHDVMTNASLRNAMPPTPRSKDASTHLLPESGRGAVPELPFQHWVSSDVNTTATNSMHGHGFTASSAYAHDFAHTVKATSHSQEAQQLVNAPAALEIRAKFGALQLDGHSQTADEQDAQQQLFFSMPGYGKNDVGHSVDAQQVIVSRRDGNGQIGHQHREQFGNDRCYHFETYTPRDEELTMPQNLVFQGNSVCEAGERTVPQYSNDNADTNSLIARYSTVPETSRHIANKQRASLGATLELSGHRPTNGGSDLRRPVAPYHIGSQRNADINSVEQPPRSNLEPGEPCDANASTAQYVGNVNGPTVQMLFNGENQVAPTWKSTKQNAGINGSAQHALEFNDDLENVRQGINLPANSKASVNSDGDKQSTRQAIAHQNNSFNGTGQPMPHRTVLQHGGFDDHCMKRQSSLRGDGKHDGSRHAKKDVAPNHDSKVQDGQTECDATNTAGDGLSQTSQRVYNGDENGENYADQHKAHFEQAVPHSTSVIKLAEFCANMVHQMWHVRGVSSYETADWPPNVPLHASTNFKNWCYHVLTLTQLSETAVMLALKYIQMLIKSGRFSKTELGNQYRLCAVAFVLANKWLDDSTYLNKTWAEVTGIPLAELNGKEMSVLGSLEFNVQVSPDEYKRWLDSLQAYTKKQDELLHASPPPPAMAMPEPFDYLRPLSTNAGVRMPMPEPQPQQVPRFVGGLVPPPPGFVFPPREQPVRSAPEDDRTAKPAGNIFYSTDSKHTREPVAYLGHAKRYSMPNARELTLESAEQRRRSCLRPADAASLLSNGSHPLSTGSHPPMNATPSVAPVPTVSPATKAQTFSSLTDFARWYERNTSTARNPSNTVRVTGKQTGAGMSLVGVHADTVPRKSSLLDLLGTDASRRTGRHLSVPDFSRGDQAVPVKPGAFEPIKSTVADACEQKFSSFPGLAALLKSQAVPGEDKRHAGVNVAYVSSPEPLHRTPQLVRHDIEMFGGCTQPHAAMHGNNAINRKGSRSPQTPVDAPRYGMGGSFANVSHGKPYGVNQAEQGIGLGGLLFLHHEDGKTLL